LFINVTDVSVIQQT